MMLPPAARDAGDLPRVESEAAVVDEAAAEHRDQVAEPPSFGGQAQEPPDPDAERPIGERLAGHGVERQVVLGEYLPRQAEDRAEPAEGHPAVRRPQAAVVGQPPLDGARHGAQPRLAIGGNAPLHPRRRRAPAGAFDERIREQLAQALVRVAGALTGVGIERQQQVAVAGERGQQAELTAVKEPEAVDDHQDRQSGRVRGGRGRGGQRRRGEPPVHLQLAAPGSVDGRDRRELRVAGGDRRRGETVRGDILGQQLLHRRPQQRKRGRCAQRREVRGGTGFDLPVRDAAEQLARGADRGGSGSGPGVESAGHSAWSLHLQVERHAAQRQQPPPELVAVPDRGHDHQGGRERVPPVPVCRSTEQCLGLPGPGRPDDEGRVSDGDYRTVAGSAARAASWPQEGPGWHKTQCCT